MEVTADVADGDQLGKLAGVPRFDLAPPLPQLRLDVGKPEQLIDADLIGETVHALSLHLGDAVLADRVPARQRPLAELHVVGGRAGEVLEQVAEGLLGADPQIHLEAGMGENAGGGVTTAAGFGREAMGCEALGQARGVVGGRDQVEVLAGLGPAPSGAGDLDQVRDT